MSVKTASHAQTTDRLATVYPINDCYTCIQGEGVQTGVAMVLLRLHGCAVGCPWCDTKETWARDPQHLVDSLNEAIGTNPHYATLPSTKIVQYIKENHPGPRWVLVTGGEPAQYDLTPLVCALHGAGYLVALETSGTEIGHVNARIDWVCVSPKLNMPGGKVIQAQAIASADEIKHVVGRPRDIDALDNLLQKFPRKADTQICLQPLSTSAKATDLCIRTVQNRGWRLSIQTHKYLDQR